MKVSRLYFVIAFVICGVFAAGAAEDATTPLKISGVTTLESGDVLLTTRGTKALRLYDNEFKTLKNVWTFDATPTGVAADSKYYYVTFFDEQGSVVRIDAATGEVKSELKLESGSANPTISRDGMSLYVSNQYQGTVSKVDLETFEYECSESVLREPKGMVTSADGEYLFVTNFLPAQRADVDTVCAAVSVIDLNTFSRVKDVRLVNGSNALRGIALSPDSKYILVSHNLGRFQVPTNQLQQGWMNTSAISIIDVESQTLLGAVLLDEPERGAAGIDHISCNDHQIVVAHSGVHEVSVIDYEPFIAKFLATPDKMALNYDLTFLAGLRVRVPVEGNGPRDVYVEGNKAYVPTYFSDVMNTVDLDGCEVVSSVCLQPERVESNEHKGEMYFNDATYCFQNWQSCNGCHPGDGRTDAMNWDLMNDGVGNSKNCKSMLYSHVTPPSMISGIRAMAEIAVRKGFNLIQFSQIPEEHAEFVDDYLKALRPVASPYLVNGELSENAKKGKQVYNDLGCARCHSGIYYTDMSMHVIGDDVEFENGWDTPTLIEVWRTAPYLFDGRAATMRDVFETHKHGINKKLSKKNLEYLVEYVNSL